MIKMTHLYATSIKVFIDKVKLSVLVRKLASIARALQSKSVTNSWCCFFTTGTMVAIKKITINNCKIIISDYDAEYQMPLG